MSASFALGAVVTTAVPVAAQQKSIKVGVMSGAEEEVAQVVKKVAAGKGLNVQLVPFSDYALVNEALERKDLDANVQHKPYLDAQIAARGYRIDARRLDLRAAHRPLLDQGEIRRRPAAIGAKIGIPNDPSNGGRALNLLAAQGLIKIKDGQDLSPSLLDIAENPKGIKFSELDAAQLPRALPDLDAAVINTDHALNAGLDIRKDTIAVEKREGNPLRQLRGRPSGRLTVRRSRPSWNPTSLRTSRSSSTSASRGAIIPAW